MQTFSRTRIAPTPSGFLHIGNAFSFALTAALAQKTGAKILLRIDDMDRGRVHPEYVQDIFETLQFLRIRWDEGPADAADLNHRFSQMQRLSLYEAALTKLAGTGKVYACDCSRSQITAQHGGVYPGTCKGKNLPFDMPGAAWRIDTDGAGKIGMKTLAGIQMLELPAEMRHFIIRKKDGLPAYQLTSVVDDSHFGIDLIVRGQDLWPSTLAQIYLAQILEDRFFGDATFYHHRLLTDAAGRKLSKSDGDISVRHWRESGRTAEEIYRFIGQMFPIDARRWEDFSVLLPKGFRSSA